MCGFGFACSRNSVLQSLLPYPPARQLAESMAGMGYFLVSLTLDSAALIAGLLAILVPVVGAI